MRRPGRAATLHAPELERVPGVWPATPSPRRTRSFRRPRFPVGPRDGPSTRTRSASSAGRSPSRRSLAYWYFFVRKPMPKLGEQIARLTAVVGAVKLKPDATEGWADARLADRLRVGDVVQTEPAVRREISFDSGNVVTRAPGQRRLHRRLGGVLDGGVARADGAHQLLRRAGADRDRDADREDDGCSRTRSATSTSNETGETGVKIFRGQARGRDDAGAEDHARRERGGAGRRRRKGRREARPAAAARPRRARRRAQLERVAPPGSSADAELDRRRQRRHDTVAIDYNVTQANLLLSAALEQAGIADTTHELRGLEVGRYFWRVAAVNARGSRARSRAPPSSP